MNQSVEVDIIVDTGDENYDYTLNCVYPHYNGIYGETVSNESAIVWLSKQQGYTKTQLNKALRNGEHNGSKFLQSMRTEVLNCTSHMNALTLFIKMTLGECFDLIEAIEKDSINDEKSGYRTVQKRRGKGYITLSKNTACGLYDLWSGAGSVLDIVLERDVKLPLKYISTSKPDGCRGYGLSEIYGMCRSFWKGKVKEISL